MAILPFALFALPIGNPYSPAVIEQGIAIKDTFWCWPKMSFAENWTFLQELSSKEMKNPVLEGSSQIFSFSWSILERLDLSVSLGTGQNRYQSNSGSIKGKFSGGLIWYGEGKIILLEILDTGFSLFGQAGGFDFMKGPFAVSGSPLQKDGTFKMRFWEAGGAISQKIGPFIPYIGAFVSHSVWKMDVSQIQTDYLHQKNPIGAVAGCSFTKGKAVSLNLEWRAWNEDSITISGEIRW